MVIYQFRCESHGALDIEAPLGRAPDTHPCPQCGSGCRRVYSAQLLGGGVQPAYKRAIDRIDVTGSEPAVVDRMPEGKHWNRAPSAAPHGGMPRLPRP